METKSVNIHWTLSHSGHGEGICWNPDYSYKGSVQRIYLWNLFIMQWTGGRYIHFILSPGPGFQGRLESRFYFPRASSGQRSLCEWLDWSGREMFAVSFLVTGTESDLTMCIQLSNGEKYSPPYWVMWYRHSSWPEGEQILWKDTEHFILTVEILPEQRSR